jgi:hypothetical protein
MRFRSIRTGGHHSLLTQNAIERSSFANDGWHISGIARFTFSQALRVILYSAFAQNAIEGWDEWDSNIFNLKLIQLTGIPDAFLVDWENQQVYVYELESTNRTPLTKYSEIADVLDKGRWDLFLVTHHETTHAETQVNVWFQSLCHQKNPDAKESRI